MKKQIITFAVIIAATIPAFAEEVDWFVGTENRIECNEENEVDRVVLNFVAESGKENFKEGLVASGIVLRKNLLDLLNDKKISGRLFEVEQQEFIKKAVCLTKMITDTGVHPDYDVEFKNNLTMIEKQLEKNMAEMPSFEDAASVEEQNNASANELLHANRGAVAFTLGLFD
ncbi:hypothetical protein [Bdellovibrio sp. GT3]|uniref:hypothetical protein n=1 Tax=Bdellovibrio sp. GT3 TaxID=3136282 RepID=UPI0030F03E1A